MIKICKDFNSISKWRLKLWLNLRSAFKCCFCAIYRKCRKRHTEIRSKLTKNWIGYQKNISNPVDVYMLKGKSKTNTLNLSKVDSKYIRTALLDVILVSSVHHYTFLTVKFWLWLIATNKYYMKCTYIIYALVTALLTLSMIFPTWNRTVARMLLMLN